MFGFYQKPGVRVGYLGQVWSQVDTDGLHVSGGCLIAELYTSFPLMYKSVFYL